MMSETASILVVEDEVGTRTTLCAILEDAGYKVIGLEKGAAALGMIKSHIPDVGIVRIKAADLRARGGHLPDLEQSRIGSPKIAGLTGQPGDPGSSPARTAKIRNGVSVGRIDFENLGPIGNPDIACFTPGNPPVFRFQREWKRGYYGTVRRV